MSIRIEGLAAAVEEQLLEYCQEVTDDVKDSVKASAKACVEELRANSPELTGDYAKGWRSKVAYEDNFDIRMQVHNKTDYQLTHLLEDGHAKVSGGRVDARPHIASAAENASKLLEKNVEMKVGRK